MRSIVVGVLVLLCGCAAPRRASVSGLASFPGTQRVVVTADGVGDPSLQAALAEGATRGLGEGRRLNPTPIADAETFTLAMHVTQLHAPREIPQAER